MTDSLRDRIAAVIAPHADYVSNGIRYCSCGWCGDSQATRIGFAAHVADAVIAKLGLRMQYENGRVMYDEKPAACKPNGNWQQRIVSPHEPYTG